MPDENNTIKILDTLANYHFDTVHDTSTKSTILKYTFIFLDSSFSLTLYINPSLQIAGNSIAKKALFVSGAMGANFASLFWAGDSVTEEIRRYFIQTSDYRELFHQEKTIRSYFAKGMVVVVGGLLPSIVPAAAAFQTSAHSTVLKILESILVYLGDLPLNIYGALNLLSNFSLDPVRHFFRKRCTDDNDALTERLLMASQQQEMKKRLTERVKSGLETLTVSNQLSQLYGLQGTDLLTAIARHYTEKKGNTTIDNQTGFTAYCLSTPRILFGLVGTAFGETELTGFTLSTHHLVAQKITNIYATWLCTAMIMATPAYLSAIFGYNTFTTMWDLGKSVVNKEFKKPLPFYIYFKLSLCFMAAALFFAAFSYATSVKLVSDNFEPPYESPLRWLAQFSTNMFNGYGGINFVNFLICFIAKNFGTRENKMTAYVHTAVNALCDDIDRLSDGKFQQLTNQLTAGERKVLLGEAEDPISDTDDHRSSHHTVVDVRIQGDEERQSDRDPEYPRYAMWKKIGEPTGTLVTKNADYGTNAPTSHA